MNVAHLKSGRTFVDEKICKYFKEKENVITNNIINKNINKKRIDYLKLSNSFKIAFEEFNKIYGT
jgi:hypothetical protein